MKEQLESVRRIRRQQRQRREAVPVPVVALVGYTNAGKSTLFNALTRRARGAGVVADVCDAGSEAEAAAAAFAAEGAAVGYGGIHRNLPHTLVTSFRATLEEVERAELLLHVRDASSAMVEEQKVQVERVLAELDVSKERRVIEVLNKIDSGGEGWTCADGRSGERGGVGAEAAGAGKSAGGDRRGAGGGSGDGDASSGFRSRRARCWRRWRRGRWSRRSGSRGTWRMFRRRGLRRCWGGTGGFWRGRA